MVAPMSTMGTYFSAPSKDSTTHGSASKTVAKISKGITKKMRKEGSRKINLKSVTASLSKCFILLRFYNALNKYAVNKQIDQRNPHQHADTGKPGGKRRFC